MLLLVLFYLTYIQVTYSLPPLPTNEYGNNVGSNFRNRYSERFLQDEVAFLEGTENAYIRGLQSRVNNPATMKNILKINTGQSTVQNKEEILPLTPDINQIKITPQSYENGINQNSQQQGSQIQQDIDLIQQYSPPHNFKVNLRGYVAPEINNGLIPPKAILPKSFLATHVTPVQKIRHPSNLMIAETRNFEIMNNRPIWNRPIIPLREVKKENVPFPYVRDFSSQAIKKSYTIVHPNGTIEESNDFEYIKKKFPHYIVHDLKEQNIEKDDRLVNTEVYAGSPIPNPTTVPIYNIPPAESLPINYQKETIVPNTLVGQPQSQPDLAKITEPIEINPSIVNEVTISSPPSRDSSISSRNLTSNVQSKPASSTLHTSILKNVQTPINLNTKNPPLLDKTIIQPSEIVHAPENGPLVLNDDEPDSQHRLDQDSKNVMLEKISADEFWSFIPDIIQISNSSSGSFVGIIEENTLEKNVAESKNVEEKIITSRDYSEINTENESLSNITTEYGEPNNETDTDEAYEIFNDNPEIVEEYLTSIQEKIEFIEPFLILNETEYKEPNITDNLPDHLNITANLNTNFTNNSKSKANQDLTEPIDVPHISLLQDDDTKSTFWFSTKDEKAWDKLASENRKNKSIAPPTLTIENDKTITIYPNGTTVEDITKTITETKQPPLITRTTKITHLNGEVKIKETGYYMLFLFL